MRLALVTQHFAPHFEGGTEAVVRAQARELTALGHSVRVISGTDRAHAGEDVVHAEVEGFPVAFLPRRPDEPYDLALERPRLGPLLDELVGDADLVHVHHWATLQGALVRRFAATRPVVVTLHDYFLTCPRFFRVHPPWVEACPERGDFEPCVRCVQEAAPSVPHALLAQGFRERERASQAELDAARTVVVPSRSHGEGIRRFLDVPDGKLVCVPHGIDRELARLDVPRWTGEGPLRILFLGHRSPVKGVHDLVAALAALPSGARERVELVLLGDEVEGGFDARLTGLAGDLALAFVGNYRTAEIAERVAEVGGAHLGVFPSRAWESYGLVPDELAALGLPVWVADRGAPKERVGAAGRVLPAADPSAWTAAFEEVLQNPDALERERQAVPARPRTARDAARELDGVYRSALGG